jgi:Holliday junction resolvase RusA-like endonuclease
LPKKQRSYENLIKLAAQEHMDKYGLSIMEGPLRLTLRAVYTIPSSWPPKRKAVAKWRTSRPDVDNLLKIVADGMNTIVYGDDAQIVEAVVQKVYGFRSEILVTVTPIDAV